MRISKMSAMVILTPRYSVSNGPNRSQGFDFSVQTTMSRIFRSTATRNATNNCENELRRLHLSHALELETSLPVLMPGQNARNVDVNDENLKEFAAKLQSDENAKLPLGDQINLKLLYGCMIEFQRRMYLKVRCMPGGSSADAQGTNEALTRISETLYRYSPRNQ